MENKQYYKLVGFVLLATSFIVSTAFRKNLASESTSRGVIKKEVLIEGKYGGDESELGANNIYPKKLGKTVPSTLSVDTRGYIYLSDPIRLRIVKFDNKFNYESDIILSKGPLRYPYTIQNIDTDSNDNIYVLSRHESSITKFDKKGKKVLVIGVNISDPEAGDQLHIDNLGNIYLNEEGTLHKYDSKGKKIQAWDTKKYSTFFVDRGNKLFFQEPDGKWFSYNDKIKKKSLVNCNKESLRGINPIAKNKCMFPPLFVDKMENKYFSHYDKKNKRYILIKCKKPNSCRIYEMSKDDVLVSGYNSVEFDSNGRLYTFKRDSQKLNFRIIRYTFE